MLPMVVAAAAAFAAAAAAVQSAVFAPATAIAVALLLWCCSSLGVAHDPPLFSSFVVNSTYYSRWKNRPLIALLC